MAFRNAVGSEIITQQIRKPFPWAKSFAATYIKAEERQPTRSKEREIRRADIRSIIQKIGRVPSYREMEGLLREEGTEASHITVRDDYKALGVGI